MRAKHEHIKRVNELITGTKMAERPQEVQRIVSETFQETMKEPEFWDLRQISKYFEYKNATPYKKSIHNFGDKAVLETIGSLGIFLSQFTDEQIRSALDLRRQRSQEL